MGSHRTKLIKYLLLIAVTILALSVIISFSSIYSSVKDICIKAKSKYKKDCVNSLVLYIKSREQTIRDKNRAVWALGQLADNRALPFLKELEKTEYYDMPKLDTHISKYEVKKAIKWCTKGNSTSWMYRNRDKW